MIKLNPELSNECKEFYDKLFFKITIISSIVASVVILIPSIILYFQNDLFLIGIIIALIFPFFVLLSLKTKETSYAMPNLIQINDEKELIVKCKNMQFKKNIDEIKCVYDYGKWYLLKTKKFTYVTKFVLQKDLITVGTIEEFEKLFEDKIIKKYKEKKNW